MTGRRIAGLGLIGLAAGLATSATLGPLALNVITFRVSETMENQVVGGDVASLAVAPVAAAAGILWIKGHRLAPALAFAPSLYALYYAISLVVGQQYDRYDGNNERFFPLYLALTILGWVISAKAWSELQIEELPEPGRRLRRATAGVLIALGNLLALAWARSIWGVATGSVLTAEYLGDPNVYWTIKLLDCAFIIPVSLATGAGLMLCRRTALKAAYAVIGFLTCQGGAVAGMAAVMAWRNDPSASWAFLALSALGTIALCALTAGWFRLCLHGRRLAPSARLVAQSA